MDWFDDQFLDREEKLSEKRNKLEAKFILLDQEQEARKKVETLVDYWDEHRYEYIAGGKIGVNRGYGELLPIGFAVKQINYAHAVDPKKDPRFEGGGVELAELPREELSALLRRYNRFFTKYVANAEMNQAVRSYQEIASKLTNYDTFKAEEAMRNVDNFKVYLAQVAAYNRIVERNINIAESILYGNKPITSEPVAETAPTRSWWLRGGRHSTIRYKTISKSSRKNTKGKKSKGKKSRRK
jgi:hypothetical protein